MPNFKHVHLKPNEALLVEFDGYGEKCAADGHGTPVMIEWHEGVPRVIVWADINKEDPTNIINLQGAQEKLREDE